MLRMNQLGRGLRCCVKPCIRSKPSVGVRHLQSMPRRRYNQPIDKQSDFIKSAILNSQIVKPKGQSMRTIGMLVVASSSLTMALYVLIQILRHKDDDHGATTIFLPLWFRSKWIWSNRLRFPADLKYVDDELCSSLENEIGTDYSRLQEHNIKYSLLEELAHNATVKGKLGFPLQVTPKEEDFEIWIELNHPSISGFKIVYQDRSFKGFNWCIKPVNVGSIAKDISKQIMDHMETATSPDSEIHSVNNKHPTRSSDYSIAFSGTMFFEDDKSDIEYGEFSYTGIVDLNHLPINKGIKLTSVSMALAKDSSKIVYKIV